jgi:uncharacterized membrane protein YgcG
MIKSATLISMALTSFVLVLLAGVVYAYQGFAAAPTTSSEQLTSSNVQNVALPVVAPSPTDTNVISPQDAASLAASFSSRKDLYSVELANFNGSQTYKVTFSSGDILYVSLTGQVVGSAAPTQQIVSAPATPIQPVVVFTGPTKKHASSGGGSSSSGGSGGGNGGGEHDGGGGD